MNFEEDITEDKISKINAAGLINLTLKELWEDYYKHIRQNQYGKANSDLDCLWIEFGGDEKEGSENCIAFEKIDNEVSENYNLIPNLKSGFNIPPPTYAKYNAKQYKLLQKKALLLKRIQNKQGKGTAYADSASDYMDV